MRFAAPIQALPGAGRRTALLLIALSGAVAQAGTLQVTVTGANGQPAGDTVVLVRRAASFQPFDRSAPVVIVQKDIRFQPSVSVVPLRGTVRFVNQDRYAHHVRSLPVGPLGSQPAAADFEFRMPAARAGNEPSAEVTLDAAGPIGLGCHLHGSMRGHLYVSPTPWFGVTDAAGKVSIEVPDGPAELQLWHPDQLSEQPALAVQVSATLAQRLQLNFAPRARPAPQRGDPFRY